MWTLLLLLTLFANRPESSPSSEGPNVGGHLWLQELGTELQPRC